MVSQEAVERIERLLAEDHHENDFRSFSGSFGRAMTRHSIEIAEFLQSFCPTKTHLATQGGRRRRRGRQGPARPHAPPRTGHAILPTQQPHTHRQTTKIINSEILAKGSDALTAIKI